MRPKVIIILLTGVAALVACGKPEPEIRAAMLASAPSVVPVAAPPVAPEHVLGKAVFDKTCGLCHGAGTGGAPRPGDKANWGPRIAQGNDILYRHALEGFNGPVGYMPARGATSLPDDEVKAAVDYMVALSR